MTTIIDQQPPADMPTGPGLYKFFVWDEATDTEEWIRANGYSASSRSDATQQAEQWVTTTNATTGSRLHLIGVSKLS